MVRKNTDTKVAGKRSVKVGRLQLDKQTIKDLAPNKQKLVKGGACTRTSSDLVVDGNWTKPR